MAGFRMAPVTTDVVLSCSSCLALLFAPMVHSNCSIEIISPYFYATLASSTSHERPWMRRSLMPNASVSRMLWPCPIRRTVWSSTFRPRLCNSVDTGNTLRSCTVVLSTWLRVGGCNDHAGATMCTTSSTKFHAVTNSVPPATCGTTELAHRFGSVRILGSYACRILPGVSAPMPPFHAPLHAPVLFTFNRRLHAHFAPDSCIDCVW